MIKKKNVGNGQGRHKCSICGRVRNENKMQRIERRYHGGPVWYVKTRYGNYCWYCVDNPDCQQKKKFFSVY